MCVLAGPVEGGYNKINSRAPPQRPGAVRGGRFLRGPGGAMDRIELIRRLNGVLLDDCLLYTSWEGCQKAPSVGRVRPTVPAQTARPTSTGDSPCTLIIQEVHKLYLIK